MPHRPGRPRPAFHPTNLLPERNRLLPVRRIYSLFQMCFTAGCCNSPGYNIPHQRLSHCSDGRVHRVQTSQPNSVGLACIWRLQFPQLPDCNEMTRLKAATWRAPLGQIPSGAVATGAYHKVRRASYLLFHARPHCLSFQPASSVMARFCNIVAEYHGSDFATATPAPRYRRVSHGLPSPVPLPVAYD